MDRPTEHRMCLKCVHPPSSPPVCLGKLSHPKNINFKSNLQAGGFTIAIPMVANKQGLSIKPWQSSEPPTGQS